MKQVEKNGTWGQNDCDNDNLTVRKIVEKIEQIMWRNPFWSACQYISKTFVKENDNGEVNGLIIAGHNFPLSYQRDSHENLDRKGSLKHYQKVHSSNTQYHQKNWGILFKSSKRQWEWKSERKYDSLSHFILPSAARLSRESF